MYNKGSAFRSVKPGRNLSQFDNLSSQQPSTDVYTALLSFDKADWLALSSSRNMFAKTIFSAGNSFKKDTQKYSAASQKFYSDNHDSSIAAAGRALQQVQTYGLESALEELADKHDKLLKYNRQLAYVSKIVRQIKEGQSDEYFAKLTQIIQKTQVREGELLNFFNHDKQLYIDFLDGDLTNEFDKVRFYCPEGSSSPSVRRGSIYFDSTSHIGIDEMKTQQMQVQSACDSHIRQIQDSNQNLQQKIDTALEQYAGNYKNRGKTFLSQRRSYKFWSELSTLISQNSQAPYNWSAFVDLGFELFPRKNDKSMSALLLNAEAESDNIISHYKNKVRGLALTSQCNRLTVQYKQVDDALLWEHKQYDDEILKRELDCNKVEIFFEELNHLSRLNEVKTKIETQADKKKLGDCLNRITKSNSLQDIHNLKQRAINIGLNRSNSAGQLTEMMYRVSKGADDRGRILLLSKVEDTGLELTDFDENITEALSRQMSDSELVKRYCNRLQVLVKEETECLRELKEYMAKQVQIANEILNHKGWLQRVGLTQHNVGVCDAVKEIKSAMITYLQGAHLAHDQLVRFQQQLKTCQQVISASSSVREKNQQINLMIERVSQARDTKQKLAAARTTLVTVIERRLGQSSFQRHHSFIVDWMRYLAGALKNILSGRKISQANSRYTKAKRWSNNLNSFFKQPSTTGGEQRVVVACKA